MHMHDVTIPWPSVPISGLRLWDTGTGWAQLNPQPGIYNWPLLDSWLAAAQAHDVDVVYDLARTPGWAQCATSDVACGSGLAVTCSYDSADQGGPGQCYPPRDLNIDGSGPDQIWQNWVKAVVQHSRNAPSGHIKYYEIWNEPTNPKMWQGTTAQLVRMTQDASAVIRSVDPSARIVTPAAAGHPPDFFGITNFLTGFLSAGAGKYVDIIGFHGYVSSDTCCPIAEDVDSLVQKVRAVAATSGLQGKALYDTEGSWGKDTSIDDQDQRMAFLARFVLLQFSAGVARLYWYQWDNPGSGTLWQQNAGLLPPGVAYGQVENWLTAVTVNAPCTASGTVWKCDYSGPSGYEAEAVWDASQSCSAGICSTSVYNPGSQFTEFRDLLGGLHSISGQVEIGAKPILLETGPHP